MGKRRRGSQPESDTAVSKRHQTKRKVWPENFFREYPFEQDPGEYDLCSHRNHDTQNIILALLEGSKSCGAKKRSRSCVGTVELALLNERVCAFCKFLVDTLLLRSDKDPLRMVVGKTNKENQKVEISLVTDPSPWYKKAGLSLTSDLPSCPYVWLEVNDDEKRPPICIAVLPDSDSKPIALQDAVYPRRRPPLEASAGSYEYPIIQEWLEICDKHENCKLGEIEPPANLKLIDVLNECLVDYEDEYEFLTLSYVWGKNASKEERWDKIKQSLAEGKFPDHRIMPQTILDAIAVTKELGKRYLWVDLLCINQSNDIEKADQIQYMDIIFASSYLTLVCVDGPDWDHGFSSVTTPLKWTRQPWLDISGTILMATCIHSQHTYDGSSEWDQRGWTFQERLLSRRCLFFSDTHYSMKCKEGLFHELVDHRLKLELKLDESTFWADGSSLDLDDENWNFHSYSNLVSVYTSRSLSVESDIHNACRGALRRITQTTKGAWQFHFGLPKHDLLRALAWIPYGNASQIRRVGFPSWSWLGWTGRSYYPDWSSKHNVSGLNGLEHKTQQLTMNKHDSRITRNSPNLELRKADAKQQEILGMTAPVIILETTKCTFQAESECDSTSAGDDLWTLLKNDNTRMHDEIWEQTHGVTKHVSFRLPAKESNEIRKRGGKLELITLQYLPELVTMRDMISALVGYTDQDGSYQRLASVVIPGDEWLPRGSKEKINVTLI